MAWCLSVFHKPVLYRNGWTDQDVFRHNSVRRLQVYCAERPHLFTTQSLWGQASRMQFVCDSWDLYWTGLLGWIKCHDFWRQARRALQHKQLSVFRRLCSYFPCFCDLLWPPCGIGQAIIFLPCGFFLSFFVSFFLSPFFLLFFFFFFPRLISAVAEWMSTILLHMVWP